MERNGFVISVKLVGSESSIGSFKGVKGFPSGFDFVIAFPMNKELAFLVIESTSDQTPKPSQDSLNPPPKNQLLSMLQDKKNGKLKKFSRMES